MSDNNAKTICTTAIWIATTVVFTFGVFRFTWTGEFSGILWAFVALALATAATKATQAIWGDSLADKSSKISSNEPPKA